MNPGEITTQFVESRYNALKSRWSTRNERMSEYEKLYLLDVWEEGPEPDERRISAPICWNVVESFRTLLLTRPPVISVPAREVTAAATDQADMIEKYLYGVWYQGRVMDALNLGEWHACCLGEGVLRVVYDAEAVEDELPLVVQALDPRTVYAAPSGRSGVDVEVIHAFERPRREIEVEWGVLLERPEEGTGLEEWLDEKVEFVDYWRADVEEVEEELSADGEEEGEEEPAGALARLVAVASRALRAGAPEGGVGVEESGSVGEGETGGEGEEAEEGGEERARTRKVRRRVVTNCVVVEGQFVKEAVKMPGYKRLPFIRYPGIATPLANEDGVLSVLFPITGGVRRNGAIGLAATLNELLAMKQRIIEMYANGALITDDEQLDLDLSPGAVNYVRKNATWAFVVPPGPHPAVDHQIMLIEKLLQDATVSATMMGRSVGAMSGLALSAMNNPVLMRIAHRQQVREWAYQEVNGLILALTEEYAPGEGWTVWGVDPKGATLELRLKPADIGGYHRSRVELSASLPKDEAGEVMSLANLVGQKLISRETFLDQLQRIKRLSSQSPQDEMKKILRDLLLFEGPTAEKLAQVVLSEYSEELAEALAPAPAPAPPPGPSPGPPGAAAGGPPGGPGMGPMMGMPPGVVPPQAMPEAVGAGGPEQLGAMLRMIGEGPPGPPGPAGPRRAGGE